MLEKKMRKLIYHPAISWFCKASHRTRKLRYRQNLLNCFWDLWKSSYELSLREKGWRNHRGSINEPQVGDLVILMEDKTPRFNWKVGTIVELCHGRDGCVRSAGLSVKSGSRTCVRLRRPTLVYKTLDPGWALFPANITKLTFGC